MSDEPKRKVMDPAEYRRLIAAARSAVRERDRKPGESDEAWAERLAKDVAGLND